MHFDSRFGRQSLVTPIDWKHQEIPVDPGRRGKGRQSLVTPIDWKPALGRQKALWEPQGCRQSLVTPIDWKHPENFGGLFSETESPILGDAY